MVHLESLKAAAKAAITLFKAKGLAPEAMKRTHPASLAKAAGISQEEAQLLHEAWSAVVKDDDTFGVNLSTRLIAEMDRRTAATSPAPVASKPRDKDKKEVLWPASPVEGISFEELVFSLLTREVQHRRLDVRPWILSSKARKAAYAVSGGRLKNELSGLRTWVEREVERIDTVSLVQEVMGEMGLDVKDDIDQVDFSSICRAVGSFDDMADEASARAKIRAITLAFGLKPKDK